MVDVEPQTPSEAIGGIDRYEDEKVGRTQGDIALAIGTIGAYMRMVTAARDAGLEPPQILSQDSLERFLVPPSEYNEKQKAIINYEGGEVRVEGGRGDLGKLIGMFYEETRNVLTQLPSSERGSFLRELNEIERALS